MHDTPAHQGRATTAEGSDDELHDRALSEEIELMSDLIELAAGTPRPTQQEIDVALGVDDEGSSAPA
jgi:hypothetical protein